MGMLNMPVGSFKTVEKMETSFESEKRADDTPSAPPDFSKKILNFGESCEYLCISKSKLADLTYEGHIRAFRPVRTDLHYRRKDLDQWLLKHEYQRFQEIDLPKYGIRHLAKNLA